MLSRVEDIGVRVQNQSSDTYALFRQMLNPKKILTQTMIISLEAGKNEKTNVQWIPVWANTE